MGTNCYISEPETSYNRHIPSWRDRMTLHMGKSSYGWHFMFHSINHMKEWKDHKKYYEYLLSVGWEIHTEYGELYPWIDFLDMIEYKKLHHTHIHAKEYPDEYNWLDSEGNSFTDRDFS